VRVGTTALLGAVLAATSGAAVPTVTPAVRTAAAAVPAVAVAIPTVAAAPTVQRYVIVPEESEVLYRVGEVLFREGNRFNVAVGRTNAVRGEVFIDRATPRNSRIGPITVDISTFRSDRERRDQAIRERWLESARFPTATFTSTAIQGLPERYEDGEELTLQVTGDLRVRDVTRRTTFVTVVTLARGVLRGTATATVRMTDFGFDPPVILGILRAENEVRLAFRFTARPAHGN